MVNFVPGWSGEKRIPKLQMFPLLQLFQAVCGNKKKEKPKFPMLPMLPLLPLFQGV